MESGNYKEKRNYVRMDINAELHYSIVGDEQVFYGTTQNISAKGLLFTCAENLKPGTLLEISAIPDSQTTPPLDATVEVIRATENQEDSSKFNIACGIKEVKSLNIAQEEISNSLSN